MKKSGWIIFSDEQRIMGEEAPLAPHIVVTVEIPEGYRPSDMITDDGRTICQRQADDIGRAVANFIRQNTAPQHEGPSAKKSGTIHPIK